MILDAGKLVHLSLVRSGVLPLIKALEKKQLSKTLPSRSALDPKSAQGAENS